MINRNDENEILFKFSMCDGYGYSSIESENAYLPLLNKQPTSWKELQDCVSSLLRLIGYSVEIEKKVPTVRETVEIDVYAERFIDFHNEIVIVECKYWDSSIPQQIIHGIRAVADDIGTNRAIVISKKGFQEGAIKSVNNTIVELYTYEEIFC